MRAPHAWLETTTSSAEISTSSSALATNVMRPESLGHACDEDRVQLGAGGRKRLVDDHRRWRRIVEQQHDLSEQAVAGAEVDDATAAKEPAHPSRHLPRLVELFARQTPRVAGCARHAMKERVVRKTIDVPLGQAAARRCREHYFQPCDLRVNRAGSGGFASLGGSGSPDAMLDLPFELFVVGQTGDLVHEHQRVLRRDLELLAARLARDLVVEPQQVVAQLRELGPIALVGSGRQSGPSSTA